MAALFFANTFGKFTLGLLPEWIGAYHAFLPPAGQINDALAPVMARLDTDKALFLEQFQVARQNGPVH